jgi:hypothetical protein
MKMRAELMAAGLALALIPQSLKAEAPAAPSQETLQERKAVDTKDIGKKQLEMDRQKRMDSVRERKAADSKEKRMEMHRQKQMDASRERKGWELKEQKKRDLDADRARQKKEASPELKAQKKASDERENFKKK